eukprot:CAMPEP_0170541438 /NCGR_PEP_ID=MMETSP0211-20121228/1166_1 /TAXON_ID=311385 /ORGANISM="Pseudokeronopsis sp., Strain OXSARD2" /LENGTH=90 /DNA_ID=CAMNT_0010844153 /DNA_START=39 /DNA_END=311 /DNA_ORIENTATION=+
MKIGLIGPKKAGKTALMNRLQKNKFTEKYEPTIGFQFGATEFDLHNEIKVKLQIWDNPGSSICRQKVLGVVLVYDVAEEFDYDDLTEQVN